MDESPLLNIKTRELNQFLIGLPEVEKKKIKQIRRKVKNRAYAQNGRTKTLCHINNLKVNNIELTKKLEEVRKGKLNLIFKHHIFIQISDVVG